ncbi:Histidine-phosphotransfer domain HPT-domain-containing protein [Mycena chlorophos]|uniref:Histidine-phosphotransfer domain HPT-domain-containing protein n=1 Tax=Mycena chlorophos TaxID=658473 RepID=A0A8H6VWD8_MYCCL|nr:Histidine-phosphotransfer domain HPT-domain-containing protein [Mycena chlorophos]
MPLTLDADAPINAEAFEQILELDDDETCTFSKNMIALYFQQAPAAFGAMRTALSDEDFVTVADRAHFIAGSSASLGIIHVASTCARIEEETKAYLNQETTAADTKLLTETVKLVDGMVDETRDAYLAAKKWLRGWYAERGAPFPDEEEQTGSEDATTTTPRESAPSAKPNPPSASDTSSLDAKSIASKTPSTDSSQTTIMPPVPPPEPVSKPLAT